ncbi:hypothetical protein [Microcoleus sp. B13-B6]|uniref:hypothetical protein n=1 Tax=Microcoleus sp. B13-B6 TaxID=2818652 RepID=UPI002FD6F615
MKERSHFGKERAIVFGIAGWKGAIAMQGFDMGKAIALLVISGKKGDRLALFLLQSRLKADI